MKTEYVPMRTREYCWCVLSVLIIGTAVMVICNHPPAGALAATSASAVAVDASGASRDAQTAVTLNLSLPARASQQRIAAASDGLKALAESHSEPKTLFSGHDDYLFDNGPPDGSSGLSHFEGVLNGSTFDRTFVDDFVLPAEAVLTGAKMCGVWFSGAGEPGRSSPFAFASGRMTTTCPRWARLCATGPASASMHPTAARVTSVSPKSATRSSSMTARSVPTPGNGSRFSPPARRKTSFN